MGLFGVETADAMRRVVHRFWSFRPNLAILYFSFAVHALLGVKSVALRRNWRIPWIEALQIGTGLLIPALLFSHVIATRGVDMAAGIDQTYKEMYQIMWPDLAPRQSLLLLVVWLHGCVGLYMVFRLRPWFAGWRDVLLSLAVLVPLFALSGFLAGMREAVRTFSGPNISDVQIEAYNRLHAVASTALLAVSAAIVATVAFRFFHSRLRARIKVLYADGPAIRTAPGATLLEISRLNSIPHASVCGGRARCSTCRVRVVDSTEPLPEPNIAERRLLARIGAPESVRLACQLVPGGDMTVQRLVDAREVAQRENQQQDPFRWGIERRVTLMFADIRGFTSIAEKSYAFDVVFVLNRFLTAMTGAIEAHGGRIDKYLGDGLMAIFGSAGAEDGGARGALSAAADMVEVLETLNAEFEPLLGARLRIGIGLHTGSVILGRIGGGGQAASLTALGDTVNIAARLEEMTKTFEAICVASDATFAAAGIDATAYELHDMPIRGRIDPLQVRAIRAFGQLQSRDRASEAPQAS